jgi:hypothetical protein
VSASVEKLCHLYAVRVFVNETTKSISSRVFIFLNRKSEFSLLKNKLRVNLDVAQINTRIRNEKTMNSKFAGKMIIANKLKREMLKREIQT